MVFSLGRNRRSRNSIVSKLPFAKFLGPAASLGTVAAGLFMLVTGRVDLSMLDVFRGASESTASGGKAMPNLEPVKLQMGQKPQETIRVATFNIQGFGKTKMAKSDVMGSLARIISQFDVVAIQEVKGGDSAPVRALVELLRNSGANYAATVSEPIGRTSQTESYAYIWDESRIFLVPGSAYVVQDPADRMHREPMVASFETRVGTAGGRRPFRFTMINVHTDPDEVKPSVVDNEMDVLDDVYVRVQQFDYQSTGEDDCILLGDLNVNSGGLRELGQIPGVRTIAGDVKTNTRKTKTYDHILIDHRVTTEFSGKFGVLDFVDELGLTQEAALQVSDHQPVWAEFSVYEVPSFAPVASNTELIR